MRKHALRDQVGVEHDRYDVVVVGGGLAGVCAAIAAARAGLRLALVHNRTVLGGNSSSEIRVWVCGATSHGEHHYARETGIMGELFVENQYRNRDGNPYYWDQLLLEKVLAEPGIRLLLGTHVDEVEVEDGDQGRTIVAVGAVMAGSERVFRLEAEQFVDASGDGTVGFLAGARYRTGRESHAEYGEKLAPVEPDDETLGSTILFYVRDAGHPVRYVAPPWAVDIASTSVPTTRYISPAANGCAYWWIELGGDRDVVHDDDQLRLELQGAALGVWDYIKNSGRFDADDLTLEWVGSVPGRREYRRFVGDHTLTEQDILAQAQHSDTVAFGGWSLDLHPRGDLRPGAGLAPRVLGRDLRHPPAGALRPRPREPVGRGP
ncbi:FAD-dependent oxidoreductase [Luteimicrobium album]|uniref:FAD-dependent oxidoreductase n=1 Tax=Luteimicrobium album TaxID=1054550 RepID=UPI0024E0E734|nr:FAD-dependent oxidoreductase [Luteimicrobium album]